MIKVDKPKVCPGETIEYSFSFGNNSERFITADAISDDDYIIIRANSTVFDAGHYIITVSITYNSVTTVNRLIEYYVKPGNQGTIPNKAPD